MIDPKTSIWVNIIFGVAAGIATGALKLTGAVPADWITPIVAWCGVVAFIGNIYMHGYSAPTKQGGVFIARKDQLHCVVFAGAVLAIAFVSLMLANQRASAATLTINEGGNSFMAHAKGRIWLTAAHRPAKRQHGAIVAHRAPILPVAPANNTDIIQSFIQDIANRLPDLINDINAADALASSKDSNGNMLDPIAHACYPAEVTWLNSIAGNIANATGKAGPVLLFERARVLQMQVAQGFPTYLKIGCAPLFMDTGNTLIKLLAPLGIIVDPKLLIALGLKLS